MAPAHQSLSTRLRQAVPFVSTLKGYRRQWLLRDLLAALAVGALFVPQGLAYARIAGVEPPAALWAGVVGMIAYALFGPSRQLMVGPEAGTALLTAAALAPLQLGADASQYAAASAAMAMLVGVLLIAGRFARAGALADFLSKPILVGYVNGAALLIIASQLSSVLGLARKQSEFGPQLLEVVQRLDSIHVLTALLSLLCLSALVFAGKLLRGVPAAALCLVAMIAVSVGFGLQSHGVELVGTIQAAPPRVGLPATSLSTAVALVPGAFSIALVGFASTVLTSRAFADKNRYRTNANQEFVGLAVGNLASGLLTGMPIAASESRTALNDANGGRTQLVGLAAALVVVAVLVFAAPVIALLPSFTLGVVVIAAAISLLDLRAIPALWRSRRVEGVLALVTLSGVLMLGILRGILVAVALSLADLLRRAARPHDAVIGRIGGRPGYYNVEAHPERGTLSGLIIYRLDAPLFFANARFLREKVRELINAAEEPVRMFVLHAEGIFDLDITAAESLARIQRELESHGTTLAIAEPHAPLRRALRKTGLLALIGQENIFRTLGLAIRAHVDRSRTSGVDARWQSATIQ